MNSDNQERLNGHYGNSLPSGKSPLILGVVYLKEKRALEFEAENDAESPQQGWTSYETGSNVVPTF